MVIVIVDDSAPLRRSLRRMLTDIPGVHVAGEAASVALGVAEILRVKPEVAILDLQLPDGSGLEVLRRTRALGAKTRVVIFTNHAEPTYRQMCLGEGVARFFDKSTDASRLMQYILDLSQTSADGRT